MIRQYDFHELGCIPGVPGQFAAGTRVLVDTDTGQIVSVQPVAATLAAVREGESDHTPKLDHPDLHLPQPEPVTASPVDLGPLIVLPPPADTDGLSVT